ncbi:MAG: LppP/LprE family lipoprotein [Actinobacteria bacterium]|nr:LppP/LprE family lipoprotein [Actinomycetota bacterium]
MGRTGLTIVLLSAGVAAAACGWSPSAPPPPKPDTCQPSDGPAEGTVQQAIAGVPAAGGGAWVQTAAGHTTDCGLSWVQIGPAQPEPNSPGQVLFFAGDTPLGPATPEPRPYITVLPPGEDTVTVQYQWQQADEAPCCPTGIGTVRFRLGQDGTLESLDPVPGR